MHHFQIGAQQGTIRTRQMISQMMHHLQSANAADVKSLGSNWDGDVRTGHLLIRAQILFMIQCKGYRAVRQQLMAGASDTFTMISTVSFHARNRNKTCMSLLKNADPAVPHPWGKSRTRMI